MAIRGAKGFITKVSNGASIRDMDSTSREVSTESTRGLYNASMEVFTEPPLDSIEPPLDSIKPLLNSIILLLKAIVSL